MENEDMKEYTDHTPDCMICGAEFPLDRWRIGYKTCLSSVALCP
jgi:hypothetical protein